MAGCRQHTRSAATKRRVLRSINISQSSSAFLLGTPYSAAVVFCVVLVAFCSRPRRRPDFFLVRPLHKPALNLCVFTSGTAHTHTQRNIHTLDAASAVVQHVKNMQNRTISATAAATVRSINRTRGTGNSKRVQRTTDGGRVMLARRSLLDMLALSRTHTHTSCTVCTAYANSCECCE